MIHKNVINSNKKKVNNNLIDQTQNQQTINARLKGFLI